jgi:hypothetical protein
MYKYLGSLVLSVCLLTSVVPLHAQDHHDAPVHQWNDGENNTWHQYLKEHKRKDHEWGKASKREQAAYWKWRDQHRDVH